MLALISQMEFIKFFRNQYQKENMQMSKLVLIFFSCLAFMTASRQYQLQFNWRIVQQKILDKKKTNQQARQAAFRNFNLANPSSIKISNQLNLNSQAYQHLFDSNQKIGTIKWNNMTISNITNNMSQLSGKLMSLNFTQGRNDLTFLFDGSNKSDYQLSNIYLRRPGSKINYILGQKNTGLPSQNAKDDITKSIYFGKIQKYSFSDSIKKNMVKASPLASLNATQISTLKAMAGQVNIIGRK